MKKNLTELVFILDRSGSMGGLEQDTISGFNAMLTRQKEQEGEANVTTICRIVLGGDFSDFVTRWHPMGR